MPDQHDTKPSPFCVRLTRAEREEAEKAAMAAGVSLGEYIRLCVFDESRTIRQTRGKAPVKDHKALAQILGLLGMARYASNLNQLARAANTGTLMLTAQDRNILERCCAYLKEIRDLLLNALGRKTRD